MMRVFALIGLCLLISQPGHGMSRDSNTSPGQSPDAVSSGHFSAAERHLIRSFFAVSQHQNGLEKNLGRSKPLPPGWQEKLAVGDSLDYQIYRTKTSLPADLLDELPKQATGTELFQIQDTIFRIQHNTLLILDFFNLTHGGH